MLEETLPEYTYLSSVSVSGSGEIVLEIAILLHSAGF
jgi:hypothetical protein